MLNHWKRPMHAIGVVLVALAVAAPAAAGDFMVTPYVWFEGLDGDGNVAGRLWAADADPFDVDHYDGGGAVTFEAKGAKWAFLGSLASVDVDQETVDVGTPAGAGNVTAEQTMVEGLVGYRLTKGGLYVVGGARSLDYDVALQAPVVASGSADWIDPVVGLWYRADTPSWGISVEGDIGVGGDSDDTYQVASLFFWHFARSASLTLGYKALDMHFEDEGSDFRMKVVTKGPVAGIAFRF
jgi:hypothetical protein